MATNSNPNQWALTVVLGVLTALTGINTFSDRSVMEGGRRQGLELRLQQVERELGQRDVYTKRDAELLEEVVITTCKKVARLLELEGITTFDDCPEKFGMRDADNNWRKAERL